MDIRPAARENRSALVGEGTSNPSLALMVRYRFCRYGEAELLLAAEVMFRLLDGYMTEKELDLVEFAPAKWQRRAHVRRRSWAPAFRCRQPRPLS